MLPEASKSSGRSRKASLTDVQQRICEKVLINLLCHKKSLWFKTGEGNAHRLNLMTIKKKLENKEYFNELQFIEDIKKMFKNRLNDRHVSGRH